MRLILVFLLGTCTGCTVKKLERPLYEAKSSRNNLGTMHCDTYMDGGAERHVVFYVVHSPAFKLKIEHLINEHELQHEVDAIDYINGGGSCHGWITQEYPLNRVKYETRAWCRPWQTGMIQRDSAILWLSNHTVS